MGMICRLPGPDILLDIARAQIEGPVVAGLRRRVFQVYRDLAIGIGVYESDDDSCFGHLGPYLVIGQQPLQEVTVYFEELVGVPVVLSQNAASECDPTDG